MKPFLSAMLAAAVASAVCAQDVQDQIKSLRKEAERLQDQAIAARDKLLLPIKVNGVALDPRIVKREAVYLTGGKLVEAKVADFFILEEVRKQLETGQRTEKDFEVSDEQVLAELEPKMNQFAVEHPGVDFWEVVRTQYGLSRETFLQQRRQAIVFDRVFFPGTVKTWPQITKEAILAKTNNSSGQDFLKQLEQTADQVDEKGNPKPLPEFWMQMMRQFVQQGLRNWSEIKYASHGLPPEVVLSVNGLEWPTEDAYEFVRKGLFVQDVDRAMQEVVAREALRQELVKKDVWVTDEEFQRRYEEYRQPYDTTPFTVEVIAVKFKGYPCLEAFRARWRLMTSFADLVKDELTDEVLQAYADKRAGFFGDGSVNLEVIAFQARDIQTMAWQPDGMQKAKERCEAVFAQLEKGEISFDDALTKKGEFIVNDDKRGRLGFLPLNQVRQQLREHEFSEMLDGTSLAAYLFFDAEVGKTVGPLKGSDAYYIARINARTPPKKRMDVKNEKDRELVREDYLSYRFLQWANEVIQKAVIE